MKKIHCFSGGVPFQIYNMGESPPNINGDDPNTPAGEPSIGSGNISSTFKKK